MADTGGELPRTYAFVTRFSDFLVRMRWPPITMLRRSRKDGVWKSLEQECVEKNMLPSIAYGYKTCSQKYKVEPQDKWCNNDPVCRATWKSGAKVTKIIGYDFGEVRRAKFGEDKKYIFRYPLIEWELCREDCIKILHKYGCPLPGKSACFFCPHTRKPEIIELANTYPELAARALRMETGAKLTKVKGLGRRFAWRDVIHLNDTVDDSDPFDEPPCACYEA